MKVFEGMTTKDLLTLKQFKKLSKAERKGYLGELRKMFTDREIREYWKLKYNSFHYYLKELDLIGQPDRAAGQQRGRKPSPPEEPVESSEEPELTSPALDDQQSEVIDDEPEVSVNYSSNPPYDVQVEPEFQIVWPKASTAAPQLPSGATQAIKTPVIAYDLQDEPGALRERLKAIAELVGIEKGEVRLKIEVYK